MADVEIDYPARFAYKKTLTQTQDTDMKTTTRQAYEAPDTSVDFIEMEQCILSVVQTNQLQDWDNPNELYDEDF